MPHDRATVSVIVLLQVRVHDVAANPGCECCDVLRLASSSSPCQVVYLSKNSLTSLSGLEQFGSLRVLGLADNLLADMEQVGRRDYLFQYGSTRTHTVRAVWPRKHL